MSIKHVELSDKPAFNLEYVGRTDDPDADPTKPVWQIRRIATTAALSETVYANEARFNCVWDDRATYFDPPPAVENDPGTVPTDGTTTPYTGTVGTSPASVPAVAGGAILDWFVACQTDNAAARRLEFSIDNGTTWHRIRPSESRVGSFLQQTVVTQLQLRAVASTVSYEVILNRLPT